MIAWKRNLLVIWIAQFLAMGALGAVIPFLPLYLRHLGIVDFGQNAYWSGLVFGAPFLVSFFFAPVWGRLGDKHGKKLMTIRAIFGLAIAQFLAAFVQDEYQLLGVRLLQGALSGFYPAAITLAASHAPKERTGYALGMVQSAVTSGSIIGPLFGGVFSDLFGFRAVFIIVGSLIVLAGFLIVFYVDETSVTAQSQKTPSLKENWLFVAHNRNVRNGIVLTFFASLGLALARPLYVIYVESFAIDPAILPTLTGLLFSVLGIFATISSASLGKRIDSAGIGKTLGIAAAVTGSAYIIHSFLTIWYLLFPLLAVLGLSYGIILPTLFTHISKNVAEERKGGILGISTGFQTLGTLFGAVSSGFLTAAIGIRFSFSAAGSIFLIIAASVAVFIYKKKQ